MINRETFLEFKKSIEDNEYKIDYIETNIDIALISCILVGKKEYELCFDLSNSNKLAQYMIPDFIVDRYVKEGYDITKEHKEEGKVIFTIKIS